jgi:hypothetical protein
MIYVLLSDLGPCFWPIKTLHQFFYNLSKYKSYWKKVVEKKSCCRFFRILNLPLILNIYILQKCPTTASIKNLSGSGYK